MCVTLCIKCVGWNAVKTTGSGPIDVGFHLINSQIKWNAL